jgi:hypothetical protein
MVCIGYFSRFLQIARYFTDAFTSFQRAKENPAAARFASSDAGFHSPFPASSARIPLAVFPGGGV